MKLYTPSIILFAALTAAAPMASRREPIQRRDGSTSLDTDAFFKRDGTTGSDSDGFFKRDATTHDDTDAFFKRDGTTQQDTDAFFQARK
ncbi:hypothetical protein B0T21DRAFT_416533 [Apiosordaria backusii]|uniref:Uncharacterized protein n=1 Tax=Apiosordaria backusii TaxID=314023 RepID=A0AA39ZY97_9PEZI|nr:hypothetical protein B0T21DRAFT_416533 [Apiosordaria backusii]